jgi:hypothetical protein
MTVDERLDNVAKQLINRGPFVYKWVGAFNDYFVTTKTANIDHAWLVTFLLETAAQSREESK